MTGAVQYQKVSAVTAVQDATPHRLVQLMFDGAITRLNISRTQIQRGDYQGKAHSLNKALAIIGALQDCLDLEKGGELAANLDRLYNYLQHQLFRANVDNDVAVVDEVLDLLGRVKSGWDAISH